MPLQPEACGRRVSRLRPDPPQRRCAAGLTRFYLPSLLLAHTALARWGAPQIQPPAAVGEEAELEVARWQRLAAEKPHRLGGGDDAGKGGNEGHGRGELGRVLLLAQVEIADAAADRLPPLAGVLEGGALLGRGCGDVLFGDLALEVDNALGCEPSRDGELRELVRLVVGHGVRLKQADAVVA